MDLQLDGRTALITGSSKGIGEAIAKTLAREKAIVVVHGRDRTQTERVSNTIIAQGGSAHAVVGDLTHDDEVQRLIEAAEEQVGGIDILGEQRRWHKGKLGRRSARVMGLRLRSQRIGRPPGHHAIVAQDAASQMGPRDQHFELSGDDAVAIRAGLFGVQGGHERNDGLYGKGGRG